MPGAATGLILAIMSNGLRKGVANAGSNLILAARRTARLQTLTDGFAKDFPIYQGAASDDGCAQLFPAPLYHILANSVSDLHDHWAVWLCRYFDAIKHLPVGFRGIDVLVNSAGLAVGVDQLDKVTPEAIDSMFDTNVKGLMNVTQAVLPIMEGAQLGLHYQLDAITRTLRMELVATSINVASVDPGLVETEFSMMRFGGDKDKTAAPYRGLIPLTGQDIAEHIFFLLSLPLTRSNTMLAPPIGQFVSRDALIEHVRTFGAANGYGVKIARSKLNKVYIGCDRGGNYRKRSDINGETSRYNTSSRLIGCPFSVCGTKDKDDQWTLLVCNPNHNHETSRDNSAHPSLRRLNEHAQGQVMEMSKAGVRPREILSSLRQSDPSTLATSQDIYSVCKRIRLENLRRTHTSSGSCGGA
ncbi:hypothetical protein BASA60_009952 [Batrachochytrium salamandrivorans]|nr:hypothetical protein BASA60_009952 [Batrachochytrium salamandrivorans]